VTYFALVNKSGKSTLISVFEKVGYVRCGFVELRGSDKIAYDKLFG